MQREYKTIILKTDEGDIAWDQSGAFSNSDEVRLGFRKVKSMNRDHYLNRWAAWVTSTREDSSLGSPHGEMCHVELMVRPNEGTWLRHSIYMKQYDQESGKLVPATVHSKVVNSSAWDSKYDFLCLNIPRAAQTKGAVFLSNQIGTPFNFPAYYYNILGARFGTKHYNDTMLHDKRKWYCTEVITAALQAMASHPSVKNQYVYPAWARAVDGLECNTSNPNSLFRSLNSLNCVVPTLPPDPQFSLSID